MRNLSGRTSVRRSLALIAVGVAVAAAAAVVIAGMSSGGETAGAGTGTAGGPLPSGHPSVTSDDMGTDGQADGAGEPSDDIGRLEALRDEDPGDVAVLLDLGEAYFMAERLDEAERTYTEALGAEPKSVAAQVGLAMVVQARGDSRRAEKALRAILEEHPDDQDAHYWLAIVFFSDGEIDAAREQWRAAARIDPESVTGRRSQSFVDLLEDGQSDSPHATD
jgi:tetratricopeptide (TPR) repeat protein